MKRALFIISDLNGGGAQRVITRVVNGLVERGWDIDLVTLNDNQYGFYPLDDRVNRIDLAIYTSLPKILFLLGPVPSFINGVNKIRKLLKQNTPRVAISFITKTNLQLILASKGLIESKIIISERSDPRKQNLEWYLKIMRRLIYKRAHLITANSKGVVQLMGEYLPANKLKFVPNPVKIPNERADAKRDPLYILCVGNLRPEKAHDITLRAFALLNKGLINWHLRIIGDGLLRQELIDLAQGLGISDRVEWTGRIYDTDDYYKGASVFVMPSRLEGMPNALLEAMSYGLPVIVSDASPGLLELVEHEKTGFVVPVEDAKQLAIAMERLINDPVLCEKLGQSAREKVADYEEERVLDVWENILSI